MDVTLVVHFLTILLFSKLFTLSNADDWLLLSLKFVELSFKSSSIYGLHNIYSEQFISCQHENPLHIADTFSDFGIKILVPGKGSICTTANCY